MSTLRDLVEERTDLGPADIEHLHLLAGDWQLLSDLSFADLVLWVPVSGGEPGFVCVAQVRPTTGPTVHQEDRVGTVVSGHAAAHLTTALQHGRIWRDGDPVWFGDTPVRQEAVPVRRRTRDGTPSPVIAVISRDVNLALTRTLSQLELNYLTSADDLAQMVADGTFPVPSAGDGTTGTPRVGDGLIRLDVTGRVTFASPNAQSAFRRLGLTGHLVGEDLAELIRRLADDPLEGTETANRVAAALRGDTPGRRDVEARGTTVLTRALPLVPAGVPVGALVLVRDVTEVRRRDRALVTKDATIRETHHRVKTNLQTVAALLRLQARRVKAPEARAALEESVRRVSSIAIGHETLAMSGADEEVEFDEVVDRVAVAAVEVAVPEARVELRRVGRFGKLPAAVATPLAMVLNELVLNAVQHGFPTGGAGEVLIEAERERRLLQVRVADTGSGLPSDHHETGERLGLQIVRTLVGGELRGSIDLRSRPGGGTEAVLRIPLHRSRSQAA